MRSIGYSMLLVAFLALPIAALAVIEALHSGETPPGTRSDIHAIRTRRVDPATPKSEGEAMERAMFGAGCFWGVEAAFRKIEGVKATAVGFSGGHTEDPTYRDVCNDNTGHAEVVLVEFDPKVVSYEKLLETFWSIHNPTTPNRQGPDVGSQYRSVIFTYGEAQAKAAQESKKALAASERYDDRPIVTEILPAPTFWRAEEYHQQYYEKKGIAGCGI